MVVDRPTELFPGVWLTGPVPRTYPERNWSLKRTIHQPDGRVVEDNVPEDMSLVLDTDKGLVVVSGCGHAGIINTLEYARRRSGKRKFTPLWADFIFSKPITQLSTGRLPSYVRLRSATSWEPTAPESSRFLSFASSSV